MPTREIGSFLQTIYLSWVLGNDSRPAPASNEDDLMATTPRRPVNPMEAAEALFKPVKKQAAPAVEKRALPETKELVSIKLDSAVIEYFQADGPGWQDRINDALRAVMLDNPKD
jgi:uncharacterized protein (DUF4415 family)